jgi:hypothetical protein
MGMASTMPRRLRVIEIPTKKEVLAQDLAGMDRGLEPCVRASVVQARYTTHTP